MVLCGEEVIAAVDPVLVGGAVAMILIGALGWAAFHFKGKLGRQTAYLEAAKAAQEGRARFDKELETKSGKLGKRVIDRQRKRTDRMRKRPERE